MFPTQAPAVSWFSPRSVCCMHVSPVVESAGDRRHAVGISHPVRRSSRFRGAPGRRRRASSVYASPSGRRGVCASDTKRARSRLPPVSRGGWLPNTRPLPTTQVGAIAGVGASEAKGVVIDRSRDEDGSGQGRRRRPDRGAQPRRGRPGADRGCPRGERRADRSPSLGRAGRLGFNPRGRPGRVPVGSGARRAPRRILPGAPRR